MKGPAGIYTLWAEDTFLYVGVSRVDAKDTNNPQAAGVWGRLNTHVRGPRTGHLMAYVSNRFVIPDLTREEQEQLRRGETNLTERITVWVKNHISYRVVICTGPEALEVETIVRRRGLPRAGKPILNSTD